MVNPLTDKIFKKKKEKKKLNHLNFTQMTGDRSFFLILIPFSRLLNDPSLY